MNHEAYEYDEPQTQLDIFDNMHLQDEAQPDHHEDHVPVDVSTQHDCTQIGMEFKDRHDAHYFFAFHGFLAGFMPIVTHVTRTTARRRKGEVIKVTMKCHCYGKPNTKQTVEEQEASTQADIGKRKGRKRKTNVQVRTNCPVAMVVRESNGIWKVARLDLDHNHPLTPAYVGSSARMAYCALIYFCQSFRS